MSEEFYFILLQDDKAGILTLFFSLFIHKGIESFTVGLQISKSNPEKIKMVTIIAIIYSFMTPMGSLAGVFIRVIYCFSQT